VTLLTIVPRGTVSSTWAGARRMPVQPPLDSFYHPLDSPVSRQSHRPEVSPPPTNSPNLRSITDCWGTRGLFCCSS